MSVNSLNESSKNSKDQFFLIGVFFLIIDSRSLLRFSWSFVASSTLPSASEVLPNRSARFSSGVTTFKDNRHGWLRYYD